MNNLILRKSISMLLITTLILSGFFIYPTKAHATMVEKTVTKYHLDIGAQHIWGHGTSLATATWDHQKGGNITVPTQTITFPQKVSNVKVYPYLTNADKFKWGEAGYTFNSNAYLNGQDDFDYNYKNYVSNSIYNIKSSSSGSNVSFSYTATLASLVDFNLKEMLKRGKLSFVLEVLGGEESVKYIQPTVYARLIAGSENKLADDVYGFMYFTPVIIQYDVTEMVEVEDPKPEEIDADLDAPASAKTGETFNVADATRVGSETILKSSTLYRSIDNADWEKIATWNGNGQKGKNTGGKIAQSFSTVCTVRYKIVSETTGGVQDEEIKTTTIEDGTIVDAKVKLSLPRYTYEGHPVTAEDESTYNIKGTSYSAERAYAEGYATNKFTIVESGAGSIHKNNKEPIYATAVFPTRGDYNVLLKISPKNGSSLYDSQPITVLKTPTVTATLGGRQKQNRKQTLDIKVATSPERPLTTLYATLTNTKTGETVTLHNNMDGSPNTLSNSENIKTRAIIKQDSDEFFTNCQLQFLTKDKTQTVYEYKVYAKDSGGNWDSVEKEFTVMPDLPPNPKISMQNTFFRQKESNTAIINAEDVSTTDGDQLERSWYVTDDTDVDESFSDETEVPGATVNGFQDCSFGTKKNIEFNKTGVGKLKLRLHVKDVWTEETLPEYISDADYLTAETTSETTVINIAPVVSLKAITARTMDILLLADGKMEYDTLKNSTNAMQAKFLRQAIDANIKVAQLGTPIYETNPEYAFYVGQPFSYTAGSHTAFENKCYTVDNKRLYTIEATWNPSAAAPYTIRAFDGYSGGLSGGTTKEEWSYTIGNGSSVSVDPYNFRFAHDDTDTYLYFISGGKTTLFTKHNGTLLTILPFEVGESNFVNDTYIFTFKEDGIYRINRKNGGVKKLENYHISGIAKRIDGKVQFLVTDQLKMKRGIFDTQTETTAFEVLPDAWYPNFSLIGIDNQGKMIMTFDNYVFFYNKKNAFLSMISTPKGRTGNIVPVYDPNGICNYVAYASHQSGSNNKYNTVFITDIYAVEHAISFRGSGTYVTSDTIVSALQTEDGKVYVATGSGYYGASAKGAVYNPANGTVTEISPGYAGEAGSFEYGLSSDTLIASHTGVNEGDAVADGSQTILARKPQTMANIICRELVKNLEKDKNAYVVGLYSNTGSTISDNEVNYIVQNFKNLSIEFYFLTKETLAGYGQAIASKMGSDGKVLYTATPAEDLADDMIKDEKTDNVMAIKATKANGTFLKPVKMAANKQYFYEYDIKPNTGDSTEIKNTIFKNEENLVPIMDENMLTGDKLYLIDKISEDFSYGIDPRIKPSTDNYISEYVDDGIWASGRTDQGRYGSMIWIGSSKQNYQRKESSSLSFKVPEGQIALLSFDFDAMAHWPSDTPSCFISIKDQTTETKVTWPWSSKLTSHGTYRCAKNLKGEVTITLNTALDKRYGFAQTFIDNLQIVFIADPSLMTQKYSVNQNKDGWTTVNGSYGTPPLQVYRGLKPGYSYYGTGETFNLGGITYVPAYRFDGDAKVGFCLPNATDNYKIRNLKVYYEEKHKKVYAIDEKFNRIEAISPFYQNGVLANIVSEPKEIDERETMVYKKGELVPYNIFYYDYENDPSKKQFWRYTHTPYNDGPHADAVTILDTNGVASAGTGKVLNASIPRFYIDGKYTVEHWQEDDTSRGTKPNGNPLYDKASNVESITFYIVGGASAPWITGISTSPTTVKENTYFSLNIGIDDAEKDMLNLTTEVYKEKKLIFTHRRNYIYPIDASGNTTYDPTKAVGYPVTNTGALPDKARAGIYEVVATVRDQTGAGLGTYKFYVLSDGKIIGYVNHTDKWDQNRKKYNLSWFKNEINTTFTYSDYLALTLPRKRGTNVFWSGEKFMLRAAVAGDPYKVTCNIDGTSYSTNMSSTGTKNGDGEVIHTGSLWNEDMIHKWGMKKPEQLNFTFTAFYSGGTTKTHKVAIVVDNMDPYWKLHRVF